MMHSHSSILLQIEHELGINGRRHLPLEDIHFLTRIIYSAPNEPADGCWCEREVDYLLVGVLPPNTATDQPSGFLNPNVNEVSSISWSDLASLESSIATNHLHYTPWFRRLVQSGYLRQMWQWAEAKATNSQSFANHDSTWDRTCIHKLDQHYPVHTILPICDNIAHFVPSRVL